LHLDAKALTPKNNTLGSIFAITWIDYNDVRSNEKAVEDWWSTRAPFPPSRGEPTRHVDEPLLRVLLAPGRGRDEDQVQHVVPERGRNEEHVQHADVPLLARMLGLQGPAQRRVEHLRGL